MLPISIDEILERVVIHVIVTDQLLYFVFATLQQIPNLTTWISLLLLLYYYHCHCFMIIIIIIEVCPSYTLRIFILDNCNKLNGQRTLV